jgi:hypothetical protein
MPRSAQGLAEKAKVAELKRLIKSRRYESLETLEDVVDAFLWGAEGSQSPESDLTPASHEKTSGERATGDSGHGNGSNALRPECGSQSAPPNVGIRLV